MKTSKDASGLPVGWTDSALIGVAHVEMGQSPHGESYNETGEGVPLINGPVEFSDSHYGLTKLSKWTTAPTKVCTAGDLLICVRGATAGRTNIAGFDACIGRGVAAISPRIEFKYLHHFIRHKAPHLLSIGTGTTFPNISRDQLTSLKVPVPPIPEQRRIVAKIEEVFSDLDAGVETLQLVRQQLKAYRQAVLKWAFAEFGTAKLGSLIEEPRYGTSKKCSYEQEGKPVLRIPNIGDGIVNQEDLKFARFDAAEIRALQLKEGDILIIRSNGSVSLVGKCALVSPADEDCLFAGYLIRLRPLSASTDSKYLIYSLMSPQVRRQVEVKAKSTSGVNNINSDEIKDLDIPICSETDQKRIVSALELRLSLCDRLDIVITEELQRADMMRQSILKHAFEGRLVPQDPNDEPATDLLKRIAKEHSTDVSKGASRKNKQRTKTKSRKLVKV